MPGCAPSFPSGAGGGPGCAFGGPGGGPGGQPGGGPSGFRAALYFSVAAHSLADGASWIGSEDGFTFQPVPGILEPAMTQGSSAVLNCASAGRAMYFITGDDNGEFNSTGTRCRLIRYDGHGESTVLVPAFPALPSQYPALYVAGLRAVPNLVIPPSGATFSLTCGATYTGIDGFGILSDYRQLYAVDPITGAITFVGPSLMVGGRTRISDALVSPWPFMVQSGTFGSQVWSGDFLPDAPDPWPSVTVPTGQQGVGSASMLGVWQTQPFYQWVTNNGFFGFGLTGVNTLVRDGETWSAQAPPAAEVFPGGPPESSIDGRFNYQIEYLGDLYTFYTSPLVSPPTESNPSWIIYRRTPAGVVTVDCDLAAQFGYVWPMAFTAGQPVVYRNRLYYPSTGNRILVRDEWGTWSMITVAANLTGSSGTIVQSGLF